MSVPSFRGHLDQPSPLHRVLERVRSDPTYQAFTALRTG